jgi:hypothetical protein
MEVQLLDLFVNIIRELECGDEGTQTKTNITKSLESN